MVLEARFTNEFVLILFQTNFREDGERMVEKEYTTNG